MLRRGIFQAERLFQHAGALAIRYGIKGPCETLAFDEDAERGRGAVAGALLQARRFLEAGRCERVSGGVGGSESAQEWRKIWCGGRRRNCSGRECERYVEKGLGQGAVAVGGGEGRERGVRECAVPVERKWMERVPRRGKPFAMDAAVSFLEAVVGEVRLRSGIGGCGGELYFVMVKGGYYS